MSLFAELKRRNVFRVGVAYVVTAWLTAQVLELVLDSFGSPAWVMKTVLVVMAAGLPLVLGIAWTFELTPEGIKRDSEVDSSHSTRRQTGQKLDRAIIVVLVLALAYFIWESRFAPDDTEVSQPQLEASQSDARTEDSRQESEDSEQSIAVLPFTNMSSNPEQEYFSDGITEEIINALVKVPGLSVPARTSVFAYKNRQQDVRDIGHDLNVNHVLEGSIRSQGKQVRITAQLINVDTGYHLWSETFDRQLENIFAVQEEIAGAIAGVLVGELGVKVSAVPNQTNDMEAYDLYLQGRAALRNRDDASITLFEEVTRKDPDFVPGWAALAMAHNSINDEDEAAIQAAEKALAMDPENVNALNAMGAALRGLNQWEAAEGYLRQALAIDPSSAELLEDWAEFLNYVGRTDEALEVTTRAIAIEPGLIPLQQEHAVALLTAGKLEEARNVAFHITEISGLRGWYGMLPVWMTPFESGQPAEVPSRSPLPEGAEVTPRFRKIDALMQPELLAAPSEAWGLELRALVEPTLKSTEDWRIPLMSRIPLMWAGQADFVFNQYFGINMILNAAQFEWLWTPALAPIRRHPRFPEFLESTGMTAYWDATSWPKWCQRDKGTVISCR